MADNNNNTVAASAADAAVEAVAAAPVEPASSSDSSSSSSSAPASSAPRPVSPLLVISSGASGDVISGPIRKEISTSEEKQIKQQKYAANMAQQWVNIIQQRVAAEAGNDEGSVEKGKLSPKQTEYIVTELVPILVEALSALLRTHEQEERSIYLYNKQCRLYPSMKKRNEFLPIEWLASYLVRHNPKYATKSATADANDAQQSSSSSSSSLSQTTENPLTLIYRKQMIESLGGKSKLAGSGAASSSSTAGPTFDPAVAIAAALVSGVGEVVAQ